ncbi:MAG: tyrosine-type recombinase/integrase [Candidatus Methylomirabilaceae bacterium]
MSRRNVAPSDLSPRHLEDFYRRMEDGGLSPTTVHHIHMTLHHALADALRRGRIGGNPAETAEPPKRQRIDLDVWTEAEVLAFLSEAERSSAHFPLYLFLYDTQTRLGEALGLRWRDVDFSAGTLTIERTLQRLSGPATRGLVGGASVHVRGPKTPAGRRLVAFSQQTAAILRSMKEVQTEAMRKAGARCEKGLECREPACHKWHETGLVFTQPNGKPLHDNNIRQRDVRRLCRKSDSPGSVRCTTSGTPPRRTCSTTT